MARANSRGRSTRSDSRSSGMMELARGRPVAAAAVAAGAAAAGLFLWSRRSQITQQLSELSDQIGDWTENMGSSGASTQTMDDTAGLTRPSPKGRAATRSGAGSRSAQPTRGRTPTGTRNRAMSETSGGNASLGANSGGMDATTGASPRGRGGAADIENT